jgi:amino-acid N-acetyltransferase
MQITQKPDFESVISLLKSCDLPIQDITPEKLSSFFSYHDATKIIGVIGLELYENIGLLRSLAVLPDHRNFGIANKLLITIEKYAISKHIKTVYLLTTTASDYFIKHGFSKISRDSVPEQIKRTSEFDGVCPKTATLMYKHLCP